MKTKDLYVKRKAIVRELNTLKPSSAEYQKKQVKLWMIDAEIARGKALTTEEAYSLLVE